MGAMRAAHALVWALVLARQAVAAAETAASAPWPGFNRNQKYVLPARPNAEDWAAPSLGPAAQSALTRSYAALAAAEAPSSTPKFQLPPRPRNWGGNFSAVLAELQAIEQAPPRSAPSPATAEAARPQRSPALGPGTAPGPARPKAAAEASGFVTTSGTNFVVDGKIKFFSGTNAYFLLNRCARPHHACRVILKFEWCNADHASCSQALSEQYDPRRSNLTDAGVVSYFKVRRRNASHGNSLTSGCSAYTKKTTLEAVYNTVCKWRAQSKAFCGSCL